MLKPEQLRKLPDKLVALYTKLETGLLKELAHNAKQILKYKKELKTILVEQSAAVRKIILFNRRNVRQVLRETINRALHLNLINDIKGTKSPLILSAVDAANSGLTYTAVRAGEQRMLNELLTLEKKLPSICSNTLTDTLFEATSRGAFNVIAGEDTYESAIRKAIKILAQRGIELRKKNGAKEAIDTVVRRCVLTELNDMASMASMQNTIELGFKYVETTAHIGARNKGTGYLNHESWQGKIYEITDPALALQLSKLPRPKGYQMGENKKWQNQR